MGVGYADALSYQEAGSLAEFSNTVCGVACEKICETSPTPDRLRLLCRWDDRFTLMRGLIGTDGRHAPYRIEDDACLAVRCIPFGPTRYAVQAGWRPDDPLYVYAMVTAYLGKPGASVELLDEPEPVPEPAERPTTWRQRPSLLGGAP